MNRKILKIAIIYLPLLIANPVLAHASLEQTQAKINKLLQHFDPNINAGIMVQSLATGKILYQKNANQLFVPASVLKVFPAAAALAFLGSDYYFQTKILAKDVAINEGVLKDDLYFYFDGDPSLTEQDVANLVATIAQFGIHTINSNIYIDDTVFDQELSGPGWMWDERNFCYAAPTSAISIDKNCLPMQLTAALRPNQPAILSYDYHEKFISIINQVASRNPRDNDCQLNLHATHNNFYSLTGCIAPNTKQDLLIAVRNVRLYAKNIILEQLRVNNIRFLGEIKFQSIPVGKPLYTLAAHKSEPLAALLKTMMKKSDNLIADAIYKKLGYSFFHKSGTWQNGGKAVVNILTPKANIDFKKMRIVDGSGLSRYNLVSPAQLVAVLRYAYHDKKINYAFTNSLSVAGADGTLKYHMPNLKGRVYAKTGNMEGVSSLAGYIRTASQGNVAFAITINSFLNNHQRYRQLQDNICTLLVGM
ncbi:serine-type D-Ala-D-Ala carboxypeptidase/endopeptidase (penicillin-binding protein 4) [Gammaproteobacteria bacterium]